MIAVGPDDKILQVSITLDARYILKQFPGMVFGITRGIVAKCLVQSGDYAQEGALCSKVVSRSSKGKEQPKYLADPRNEDLA